MQDVNQQAYDRGTSIFSPDGRLYQVEYAREAVERGTSTIGVRTPEGVVLLVDKRVSSSLMERDSVEKLHAVDDHVGVASAGHVADGRKLVDYVRRDAQRNRLRFGERIDVKPLTTHVTDLVQAYTQVGGARPFGVALLIAGIDRDGSPRLFETDPSGTPYEWRAVAVGADRGDVQAYLEANYDPDGSLDDGVRLALAALAAASDDSLDPTEVAAATVDVESERFVRLTDDEIEAYLADVDANAEAGDDAEEDDAEEEDAEEDDAEEDDAEAVDGADGGDDADAGGE